ncbi:unnamed protein product [Sphenostylis stenocarpa]|uniref:Uncharacterized protein n=1 Tax=Sphenostylis stenocarpa TaxID=92480 RepID=A0AA86V2P0_9FABA|nr:unnamed protein product [Sphenostylis stenocarpa]
MVPLDDVVEGKENFLWRLNCVSFRWSLLPQIPIALRRRRSDLLCISLRPRQERVKRLSHTAVSASCA